MSIPKILSIFSLLLFSAIAVAAMFKNNDSKATKTTTQYPQEEIVLEEEVRIVPSTYPQKSEPIIAAATTSQPQLTPAPNTVQKDETRTLPEADRIEELFRVTDPKLPFVETIVYKSRVPWQKGRPAWVSDYASYYQTSRHFIARSLNGKADYFKQDIAEGDRFNVLKKDKNLQFYLLVDSSRSKLWLYAFDTDTSERTLLKTYSVGLGRVDSSKDSGLLTPIGKYSLGDKIAIYKPNSTGFHNNEKVEMIKIFGSRWIPFDKEIANCTAPGKGLGIHGVPWSLNSKGVLTEDISSLGKYESDGCIRLSSNDIEEIFAIIITKPAFIEIVKDFFDAKLPGVES